MLSLVTADKDLQLVYSSRTIEGLFSICYSAGVDMNPDYQRGLVWNDEDKESLIESVFDGIDIEKFVFVHNNDEDISKPLYSIFDGKQRLSTLKDYYENRFPYKTYYYNDLSDRDKHYFTEYPISYAEARGLAKKEVYELFIKLNTTGYTMDKKDIDRVKDMLDEER